jgi:hypothetical protein
MCTLHGRKLLCRNRGDYFVSSMLREERLAISIILACERQLDFWINIERQHSSGLGNPGQNSRDLVERQRFSVENDFDQGRGERIKECRLAA